MQLVCFQWDSLFCALAAIDWSLWLVIWPALFGCLYSGVSPLWYRFSIVYIVSINVCLLDALFTYWNKSSTSELMDFFTISEWVPLSSPTVFFSLEEINRYGKHCTVKPGMECGSHVPYSWSSFAWPDPSTFVGYFTPRKQCPGCYCRHGGG